MIERNGTTAATHDLYRIIERIKKLGEYLLTVQTKQPADIQKIHPEIQKYAYQSIVNIIEVKKVSIKKEKRKKKRIIYENI